MQHWLPITAEDRNWTSKLKLDGQITLPWPSAQNVCNRHKHACAVGVAHKVCKDSVATITACKCSVDQHKNGMQSCMSVL